MDRLSPPFRKAAVFGAGGGIGAALCRELHGRGVAVIAASRSHPETGDAAAGTFHFDLDDESSIAAAAQAMRLDPPDLVIVATGVLTLTDGRGPEKAFRQIEAEAMARIFAINTIGPTLVAKHMLPILPRDRPAVLGFLSARVGSIADNRLGGWHSYRASKAALNMIVRGLAIEMARTHPLAAAVSLHPGTVDTALSRPFQARAKATPPFAPDRAAGCLIDVLAGLSPAESGGFFAWDGQAIPF